ncbi:aminopeptidase [Domibacillus mangrovi]|uniref:Aminopeptidase n=1 Tax=Domibacillus mangrovi TaxID=1714354 RepID=A0A1Q5P144_9BACI|nr:aminopeptidase [Domibacillus mangrovi]OKL35990.1 aminopeptidase [Domibacillus mangrovi]
MTTFQEQLEKYAQLSITTGVNVQPDQSLVIRATLDAAELVRLVVQKAYEAGAKHVYVDWSDDTVSHLKYKLAPDSAFNEFPAWNKLMMETLAEEGAAFMSIISSSPDLLKDVDSKRIAAYQKTAGAAMKKYREYIQSDKVSWTVIAAPSKEWADKVFAYLPEEERIPALWNAIFKSVRADHNDPVQSWKEHDARLCEKVAVLNEKHFKTLHYTAPGTDLTIDLPDNHLWVGAGSVNEQGHSFMANMPTEEVFTVPVKTGVNGYVKATKPLSYAGNIINGFTITFEKGRIVNVIADEGEDVLRQLIETDEGAHYLGEVALVPHNSPISNAGILFFNTLFDENASNHLAIGSSYAFCIEGGKAMSQDELEKNGLNTSMTHVDFMIGSADMNIDGIMQDGTCEPVFRNGNWA